MERSACGAASLRAQFLRSSSSMRSRTGRRAVREAVVEAYFGTQAAEEGVRCAEDLLAHAAETERFVRERNAQGLALDADLVIGGLASVAVTAPISLDHATRC